MPDLPIVVVPHPLGGIPEDEVREHARASIDKIIKEATRSTEHTRTTGSREADARTFKGSTAEIAAHFYRSGWTDGFPVVPPTERAVKEMLMGTDWPGSHQLGPMPPSRSQVTVEKVAINAVMAGCRPTYMPVLLAAVSALLEKDIDLTGVQSSTGGHSPFLLINGPIRNEIRINCATGALGPGWQANATIGRAIRLILNNVGGARIGVTDMSTLGMAENITYCLGENEEYSPWTPFHVERGLKGTDSAVSVLAAYTPERISDHVGVEPEEILAVAADVIARITRFHVATMDAIIPRDSILLLCPEHARSIANAGWTKKDIQAYLFKHSQIPYDRLKKLRRHVDRSMLIGARGAEMVPMFSGPERTKIVIAGGPGKHSAYINSGHSKTVVTRKIALPKNWNSLVEQYRE
jgi:hypothetical protein